MNPILKEAFDREMNLAKELYAVADYAGAMRRLERAHVLGQRNAWPHTINHWWMLKVGLRRRDRREIFGQIPRLLGGGLVSLLGRAPIGNTGGANVGIMKEMPIEPELVEIFRRAGLGS